MEVIQYPQKTKIKVPNYELYVPKGEFPNKGFSLEDAKRVLGRWGIIEPTNNCWGDPWNYEMAEIYRAVKRTKQNDGFKSELVNMIIAKHIQNQFSRVIMDSMSEDCDFIVRSCYQACNTYFMRDRESKGIVVLQEPPSQYMIGRKPDLDFKIESSDEVNLKRLVNKTEDYVANHWNFPMK